MKSDAILLVEDNPDDQALTIRALRKNNITNEIIVAHDGVEALDFLFGRNGKQMVKPAVVLLDLNMPRLNGIETLQKIRANEQTETLPVVMLTTSDQEADVIRSYRSGVNSYIRKPIEFSDFSKIASQLGVYWVLLNQHT